MSYNISRKTRGDSDAVIARVKDALKTEGFGVLTEIDVAGTLKAKINQDFRPYRGSVLFAVDSASWRRPCSLSSTGTLH